MKEKKIIVITGDFDPAADAVILRLRELGHQPIRLDTRDMPVDSSFTLNLGSGGLNGVLRTKNHRVALDDIGSIWLRRAKPPQLAEALSEQERIFAETEFRHALSGLWSVLDCYWMSFPESINSANWKPGQLKRATQLGFEIPRTLITTDPDEALAFYKQCNQRVIYKVLSDPSLGRKVGSESGSPRKPLEKMPPIISTYTTLLKEKDLAENLDTIRNSPCQFQEYFEKKFEYRVTIIGDDIFIAEIDSQAQERTRIDWRHYDVPMIMREGFLPPEVVARCFNLVKGYGLNYSAMDLILTPDGRYIFLESNPNGQWQFVEHHVPQLKMVDAISNCLIRGKG